MYLASKHLVVAGHYLAAQAGLQILEAGGNAVDAGVAAGISLGVVQSDLVNVAGVAPIMIRLADSGEVVVISGLGHWPRAARLETFVEEHGGAIPPGVLRSVVPAAPDAWITALSRFGTMRFAEVVAPAVRLAQEGFPVHPLMAETIATHEDDYRQWTSNAAIYLPGGRPPSVGDVFRQPDLAATLNYMAAEEAAASGDRVAGLEAARRAFYVGDIAARIAAFYQAEGGWLDRDDLAEYRSAVEAPVMRRFRDLEVYSCGPWCQGPVLHQILAILERLPLDEFAHNTVAYAHAVVEAMRLAFHDRERHYGDPRFVDVPLDRLLGADHAAALARTIDPERARDLDWPEPHAAAEPQGPRDTSYVCVVDRAGNLFSATPSDVSFDVPVVPGTGLCVSSRGAQSWAVPGHPSAVAPGKRPRLTPNPAMIVRPGELLMPIGTPGGDVQTQAMLQVILNTILFGMDVQTAVEAPRFATYDHPDSFEPHLRHPKRVMVEPEIADTVGLGLDRLGHEVMVWPTRYWKAGGVCTIAHDPRRGVSAGGADPRRPSGAAGF